MKKTVKLSCLGNQHVRDNLIRFYPFLRNEFRQIKESEIKKVSVFEELFGPDVEVNLEFLRVIFKFQQCDTKTRTT